MKKLLFALFATMFFVGAFTTCHAYLPTDPDLTPDDNDNIVYGEYKCSCVGDSGSSCSFYSYWDVSILEPVGSPPTYQWVPYTSTKAKSHTANCGAGTVWYFDDLEYGLYVPGTYLGELNIYAGSPPTSSYLGSANTIFYRF